MFSPADVDSSSTYRELKAVFYVLKSYADSLKHQRVKVFVDNMGVYYNSVVACRIAYLPFWLRCWLRILRYVIVVVQF